MQQETHALQQMPSLFDDLISPGEQRRRYGYPVRLRCFDIDNQLAFGSLLYGRVRWFCTFEDLVDVGSDASM